MKEINDKIKNAVVIHAVYGKGIISDLQVKNDGKAYVTVVFSHGGKKTTKDFSASIVFPNNILVFEDQELQKAVKMSIERNEAESLPVQAVSQSRNTFEISNNDITNILIESVLSHESIAVDLISLYDDTAYEKELLSEAFKYLTFIMSGAPVKDAHKACILVALSLIALKYYDGDLHSYIEKKFREYRPGIESRYTKTMIQNGVYKSVREYRSVTKYFDEKSYVAVPIIFSCVPHYRLKDLFRIAYDIYKQKLLFDEEITDEQITEKVREVFHSMHRKDLISDSDQIKGTSYLMSKYTQSCIFSGFGLDALSKIVAHCIRLIILHLTQPEDSFQVEAYYDEGYCSWVESFESDDGEKAKYESKKLISQPFFKLIHNRIHLFTGEYSMDESYDPNDIHVCVYNGDGMLLQDYHITDPDAVEFTDENSALSGYIVKRQDIIIDGCPLGQLSYTIVSSGDVLYDSKTRLNRNNLFFDGKGNEVKPGSEYNGEIIAVTRNSNREEYGEGIKMIRHENGYYLSGVEVNNRDVFQFDGETYIFHKVNSSQLISFEIPWADFVSVENKTYHVFGNVIILFPASCSKEDIYLEIDNEQYTYGAETEITYSIRVLSKASDGGWVYTVKVFNLPAGYHSIRIFNSASGKQIKGAHFEIVVDSTFHYHWRA